MKTAIAVFLLIFAACCVSAELSPHRQSAPPSRDISEQSPIEPIISDAGKAIDDGDCERAAHIVAFIIFAGREVAPAFLPDGFAARVRLLIDELKSLSPAYASKAARSALDFLALRCRLLKEGFFSDGSLCSNVKGLGFARFIADNTLAFEWFPEDDRIASLRVLFILDAAAAVAVAEGWMKSENSALLLAAINLIGVARLEKYGKTFEKRANDTKIRIELRIEYALAAERLGRQGLGVLKGLFLFADVQLAFRLRSMEALAALGSKTASPLFIRIIVKESPNPVLLAAVIEMLTVWREASLAPYVGRFLESKNQKLVRVSIRAIGRIGIVRLYPSVASVLSSSKNPAVQAEALKCLALTAERKYLPVVAAFIYNRVLAVRLEAALAVQKFSGNDFGLSRSMDTDEQEVIIRRIRVWWQERGENAQENEK